MRVFIAGATGVVGRPLVRELVARGHRVVATSRSPENRATPNALGAEPREAALDAPPPRRVPTWLARLVAGSDAVELITTPMITGSEAFQKAVGWKPRYLTVHDGLAQVLAAWREAPEPPVPVPGVGAAAPSR